MSTDDVRKGLMEEYLTDEVLRTHELMSARP